jgi:cell wall-associated NlpC family hydrolase
MASIKTPLGDAPAIPVMLLMIGGYIAWFGVHYFKSDIKWPTDPVKSVLTGGAVTTATYQQEQQQQASLSAYVASVSGDASSAGASGAAAAAGGLTGGSGAGSSIATDAQKYIGAGYVWGGNASQIGDWDCSSFTSYVLGHDLNLPLPGGHWGDPGFPPHAHGPTTGSYALYGTQIDAAQVAAGDLVVWSTHMGIAIDGQHIVSARDPKEGVGIDSILDTTNGLGGEIVRFRRVPA